MLPAATPLPELALSPGENVPVQALLAGGEPVVLRGVARDWELVRAGRSSMRAAMDYLRDHDNGQPVTYSWGAPEVAGRPFYDAGFTGLNCEVRRDGLGDVLDGIARHIDDERPPTYYVASLPVDARLPRLRAGNDRRARGPGHPRAASIWIGNRVIASCHYDALNNIACCAVGRRRFTLFPPEQIANLYPGPLAPTPGGQAVSIVDFAAPDLQRHPRFAEAWATAREAVLEPGDAIFMPSLWWHHVQGLEPFNVLINYWWSSAPAYLPTPMHALYHALWTIRDRPEREKRGWRAIFDHYVFGAADQAGAHLPQDARGVMGPLDEAMARQLRAMLIDKLNR